MMMEWTDCLVVGAAVGEVGLLPGRQHCQQLKSIAGPPDGKIVARPVRHQQSQKTSQL